MTKAFAILVVVLDIFIVGATAMRIAEQRYIDNAIDIWFNRKDPALELFELQKKQFDSGSWIAVNVWTDPDVTKRLGAELVKSLQEMPSIGEVTSLLTATVLQDKDGLFYAPLDQKTAYKVIGPSDLLLKQARSRARYDGG